MTQDQKFELWLKSYLNIVFMLPTRGPYEDIWRWLDLVLSFEIEYSIFIEIFDNFLVGRELSVVDTYNTLG